MAYGERSPAPGTREPSIRANLTRQDSHYRRLKERGPGFHLCRRRLHMFIQGPKAMRNQGKDWLLL
jgi:hypothetical protein